MHRLGLWLQQSRTRLTIYAGLTAFCLYLAFYPFRRAYTAATYEGLVFFGVQYKILLITAQVIGFAISKGLGIKFVSEMQPKQRGRHLLLMLGISLVAYLFFGLVPPPYNLAFMLLASLPLGMVYGVVLGYLEGRLITDLLVAILTASFIVGSGFAKSVGSFVMNNLGFSSVWMPFISAALMFLPYAFFVWLMGYIPPPDATDQAARTERKPMQRPERKAFIQHFLMGIVLFTISYVLLTTFREFRDNFTPELWKALGQGNSTAVFTKTEVPIAITVVLLMAAMRWVQNNYRAFAYIHLLMLGGGLLIGVATYLFQQGFLSAFTWITSVGMGGYVAYAMCNSLYFERLLATFKQTGTVGFLITFADYYAYLGSVGVLLYKNYFQPSLDYLHFFITLCYAISCIYVALVGVQWLYYRHKFKNLPDA